MTSDGDGTPSSGAADPGAELTIQQVSDVLGVPAPTIRSWERRYGVPQVGRSQGGHRRYSAEQVGLLARMRDEIARGHRAVDAAQRVLESGSTSPTTFVDDYLRATMALDPTDLDQVLDAARAARGLGSTVDEVIMPALREIGWRWQTGRCDVAHEHLASQATVAWLVSVDRIGSPPLDRPIILGSGPLDHVTVGLECIAALLRQRGWDCRMLGARLPAESLARAVDDTDAAAVIVVCHLSPGRRAAVDALQVLAGRHLAVFYAGGAFTSRQSRHGVPGHYLGTNLERAADEVTSTVLGGQLSPPTGR